MKAFNYLHCRARCNNDNDRWY